MQAYRVEFRSPESTEKLGSLPESLALRRQRYRNPGARATRLCHHTPGSVFSVGTGNQGADLPYLSNTQAE